MNFLSLISPWLIGHYLSSNNEMCYSVKTQTFSTTKHREDWSVNITAQHSSKGKLNPTLLLAVLTWEATYLDMAYGGAEQIPIEFQEHYSASERKEMETITCTHCQLRWCCRRPIMIKSAFRNHKTRSISCQKAKYKSQSKLLFIFFFLVPDKA